MAAQFAIAIVVGYVTTRAVEFPFLRMRDALFPAKRKVQAQNVVDAVEVVGKQA